MKQNFKRKLMAGLLSVCMMFQTVGTVPVYAAGNVMDSALPTGTSSVCTHHVHDEKCGYTEDTPCTHEHTDECSTEVTKCVHEHTAECYPVQDSGEATGSEAKEPTACTHICDEKSGCVTKELACKHVHDDKCGYKEGKPCTFDTATCESCKATDSNAQELSKENIAKVQALIDALPTLEALKAVTDKEEQNNIYTDLQTAYDAYQALTKEEQAEVTGAEVFEALFNYFNTMTETLAEGDGNIVLTESSGALTIYSDHYKLGSTEYTYSGDYTLSGTTTSEINFYPGTREGDYSNAHTYNVTMNGLTVNVGETNCAISIDLHVTANITLTGANSITGSTIAGVDNTTIFTVTDASTGSLTMVADAEEGTLGGYNKKMGIVNLNGGTITVTNRNTSGNAIGISTSLGKVNINGANVTAVGSSSTKYAIANNSKNTIGGNSIVRASSPAGGVGGEGSRTGCIVYNSTDGTNYVGTVYEAVALDTLDVGATDTLLIPAGASLTATGAITDNGKIHVMGTLAAASITKGADAKLYKYDGGTITGINAAEIDVAEAAKLDIANGSITIEEDGYTQGSGSKQTHYGTYEITGKGNWLNIKSGSPSITLTNVENGNFSVPDSSSATLVSLTLSGTNQMNISDTIYSSIKINGAGTLSVNGGMQLITGKSFTLDQATVAISGQIQIWTDRGINVNSGKLYVGTNMSVQNININGGTVFVGGCIDGGFTLDGDAVLYAKTINGKPTYTKGIVYTGCTISHMSVNGATVTGGTGKIYGDPNVTDFIKPTDSSLGCALIADNIGAIPDVAYTGTTALPNPTVKVNRIALGGEKTLVQDTDYTVAVTSTNTTNVGTATATITGKGGFSGTFTKEFNIVKSGTTFDGGITLDKTDKTYTYGDTITVTAKPKATGIAARSLVNPTANQMALFVGSTQITAPVNVGANGVYTMTYDTKGKKLAVGSNTITAKYVGNANMADYSESVTITLNQKAITPASVNAGATKVYDGNTSFTGVALTLNASDILSGDTITATADGTAADANVGATKTFTATSVNLGGAQAGYYSLAADKVSGNVAITKAEITGVLQEYPVVNGLAKDYSFDLSKLLPSISSTQEYGNVTYTVGTVGNTDSVLTAVPTNSDIVNGKLTLKVASVADTGQTATVEIQITTDNFTVTNAVITVKTVDKISLEISNVTMAERVYNGSAYAYTGTPTFTNTTDNKAVTGVSFTTEYQGRNGTSYTKSATAPTNAGKYNLILTVSGASAGTYAGTLTVSFAITQKEVTVKAKDKDILVGAEIPSLTTPVPDTDYTVAGFIGTDTLGGTVSMSYTGTPDNTKHGSYPITISGGTASDNYTVKYENGTLTISIDVSLITAAITAADNAKGDIATYDTAASSVANGTKFVTTAEMTTLNTAIQTATAAKASCATLAQVQAAAKALDDAVADFKAAIKTGTYTAPSGGGGSTGGGSSSGGTVTPPPTTITPTNPNPPTTGEIKAPATVDNNGNASITVTDQTVADAIKKAQDEAKKNGTEKNGVSIELNVDTDKKAPNSISANLPKAVQDSLVEGKVSEFKIVSETANLTFDSKTLQEIQKQAGGDATINASKADVSKLSKEARDEIGNRPVFNLSITGKDGKNISDFGGGSATVSIPYTLQPNENPNNLQAYFVDAQGKLHEVACTYDPVTKCMVFVTNHFSTYGIGYKANAPKFSDIANHWAKNDIEFVTAKGLLSGTSANTFSPDSSVTTRDFATALTKLSGKDVSTIVENSNKDATISRQEIAVIMQNFAKLTNYNLPQTRGEIKFSDTKNEAVKSMQIAGVIMGKDGNRFDPTATATRAEASAVLRRYTELVIDKTTAQGLDVNDSGKIVYYESGKLFTGVKTIDGTTYHFGNDGICTKMDAMISDTKKYIVHKVVRGDTLWNIAMKNKCTVGEIVGLNGIKNPNNVPIGTELKIPQK